MSTLKELFSSKEKFVVGAEVVSTRGIIDDQNAQKTIQLVKDLCHNDNIDWVSITDNAGGNPMLSADYLGKMVKDLGKEVILHLTCKDLNRNGLESVAWKYASEGFDNILVLSGDFPISGLHGNALPVFDLDSVGLLQVLTEMNEGIELPGRKPGSTIKFDKTNFHLGCSVSPFKWSEAALTMQYDKLWKKVEVGAHYTITQLGYDIRKSQELIIYMKEYDCRIPIIGNIYKLSLFVARMFNKGIIPGCVVTDELLARIEEAAKSEDKGRNFFLDLCAKQFAAYKGLGYDGVYIGGVHTGADYQEIIDRAKALEGQDWRAFIPELTNPKEGEFYLYEYDETTKLSNPNKKNPVYIESNKANYKKHMTFRYAISRFVHNAVFDVDAPFFGLAKKFYKYLTKHKGLYELAYRGEKISKTAFFDCEECGDCSLPEITYLCPQSQCAKNQRNGPCGGSLNDMCEVASREKECIWVQAYNRNKYMHGIEGDLLDRPMVIKNNHFYNTSSWSNWFLGKDHNAFQIKEKEKEKN